METPCTLCGQPMVGRVRSRAKFCSTACKDKARNEARRQLVVATRPERACQWCHGPIDASRSAQAVFCSYECDWKFQNKRRAGERKLERRSHREPCPQCGAELGADLRAGSTYCTPECKKRANGAIWREKSPGYMRQYLYGITPEEYAALLASQDGRCAICRTEIPGGKGGWHVDHDHETKSIRGLLCHYCNLMLGNAKDDPARLRAAASYLEVAIA